MANVEDAIRGKIYDKFFREAWEAVIAECNTRLEDSDRAEAGEIKGASEFRTAVEDLVDEFPNDPSRLVIMLLLPTIKHYEMFADTFVAMMAHSVNVSMLWGLLFLVVKLSLWHSPSTLERISVMLKEIGNKIELINKCLEHRLSFQDDDTKNRTLQLNRHNVYLWLDVITIFQNQDLNSEAWENIGSKYNETSRSMTDAAEHFERLLNLQSQMINWATLRNYLPLQGNGLHAPLSPCNNIPVSQNKRFYGRENILKRIGEHLQPASVNQGLLSVALYGLHGLGKSQIALSFAYRMLDELDAVLWVSGESELAMQQSLSDITMETLRLPDAQAGSQQENSILFMHWLKANSKWLLIYDNVTGPFLSEKYWPVARNGLILITTNRPSLTSQPVDKRIEVLEFDSIEGARFLVQLIPDRVVPESDPDFNAARKLSEKLGGHALGISQMAALINSRGEAIEKFLIMYEKNEYRCHKERKSGWRHADYKNSLATIWTLLFGALEANERLCLGILCFFVPNSIPSAVFEISDGEKMPSGLKFCSDDFIRGEVIERLADLGLIRHAVSDTLSIHRLVQVQYLFHIEKADRQEAFDAAVKLLLERFPSRGKSRLIDKDWPTAERYIQHALAVIKSYRDARTKGEPLRSSGDLCNLICDVTWYLMHNDTANNLGQVLATGFEAYEDLDDPPKYVLIKAYLLGNSALNDLNLGEFHIALTRMQESLKIQLSNLDPDDEQILNSYNNLGIAHGSLAEYDRGQDFLDRAEVILKNMPGRNLAKSVLLNVNMGRNYYCMGRYDEAETRLKAAMADSLEMNSWYWRAIVHLAFTSLYCRTKELDKAQNDADLAKGIIHNSATINIMRLIGVHAYKAGRVALAQGRFEESIPQFETANNISQALNLSPGNRARILFALSVALHEVDKRRDEAPRIKLEVAKFQEAALEKAQLEVPDDETFNAYDLLVRILDR